MKIASLKPLNDGIDASAAEALWNDIEGFAAYSFNRSHTVEYTLISYQSMWLKQNFPVEFFAAALSLMDQSKIPGILKDAQKMGIEVSMPDINVSTGRFEIATDARLVIPFMALKGIAQTTVDAILAARQAGPFKNKADFLARVEKRKCNARHQEILDKVGAFARIEPGQAAPNDQSRLLDQIELLPGLVTAHMVINRDMHRDKLTKEAIAEVVAEYRRKHGPIDGDNDGTPVKPFFGKHARFMLIQDCPNADDDNAGMMGYARATECVVEAMREHGLEPQDVYWTALVKRPKADKQVSAEEIKKYRDYLEREIDILKPPIIVLMGTSVTRHFLPDLKGKVFDHAGKVVYSRELDANLVVGFNPGEIWFSPEKQETMVEVFKTVMDLLP